jgi:alpha-glucosidase
MYFTKIPYAGNFEFARSHAGNHVTVGDQKLTATVEAFENDIFHLQVSHPDLWSENHCLVPVNRPQLGQGSSRLEVSDKFELTLRDAAGNAVLSSQPGESFGLMGVASMFCFQYNAEQQFYGLGEKTFGTLEVRNRRTRFWNTDALGDFNYAQWVNQPLDPYYVSVPYVIIRVGNQYVGLLYENPYATFIDTGSDPSFFGTLDANRKIVIGSEGGLPSLWILFGPSLAELTSKLQRLVGTTPLPPAWSLGYHQCKWGYMGEKELTWLDEQMERHQIPNDGLWLDIDYMDGYRVFTYADQHWPNGVKGALAKLVKNRRRVVPIIDPGVKLDPGYAVYDSGKREGVFCLNPQGRDYVGFVWPGETVFPDFSVGKGRDWWAAYAKEFRALGFAGAWLDMNDPSTGSTDPMAMRFQGGKLPHEAFHNQYALGMQMATREGFQAADPNARVFLLSRSGFIGTSRYAAIWTGDNLSDRFYLKGSIPTTLNLGLSGIPFNGPDAGGFMGDTNEALYIDWMKAGFLFPFLRVHSVSNCRPQEPWAFGAKALKTLRHYIRLRYRLMPYLYNLFIDQEQEGHPILRPLIYHYDEKVATSDQFLVGDAILQAPHLEEGDAPRNVNLPGKRAWFDARTGEWTKAGKTTVEKTYESSPLYFRDGAIVPTLPGERTTNEKDLRQVEFHVFCRAERGDYRYRFDDGETLDYQRGKRSEVRVRAEAKGRALHLSVEVCEEGFGPVDATFVAYGDFDRYYVNGERVRVSRTKVAWTGEKIAAVRF